MRTNIRFKSSKFAPLKPEEEQVNPEVYGEELAKWIFENIGDHGLKAADYFGEDWGWMVVFGREFPVWIGCGNIEGEKDEWYCSCETNRSITDRLFRRPLAEKELRQTISALFSLIKEESEISEIECFETGKKGQEFDFGIEPFDL